MAASKKAALTKLVESETAVSELELKVAALKGQESASKDNGASTFGDRDGDTTHTTRANTRSLTSYTGGSR